MVVIRDAIHGTIELSPLEERIVDSQWMQRLRFVRQLSTAYLVFPSAQHTRFEHSLGAMHLSGRVASQLGFSEGEAELLRVAALLHDVGHGAFAHDTDPLLSEKTGKMHEERGIELVEESELGDYIGESGLSSRKLFSIMRGEGIGGMLTSDLGTDRMDYLLRDAYFTGVAYSIIDADRLLRSLAFRKGEVLVTEKGRLASESLLVSRYFMFNVVYYHPTIRIAGRMIEKAIANCLDGGRISVDEVKYGADYGLLQKMAGFEELARRVLERKLFKKAFVCDTAANAQAKQLLASSKGVEEIHQALENAGLGEEEFVLCLPARHSKKFSVSLLRADGKVEELAESSHVIRALQKERREAHFILGCEEKNKQKAAKAVKKLLE